MVEELRHFLLIAAHGTFTEAARRAHLSQPALTASMRRLEAAVGARLLLRGPGGASLTAAGEALRPHAEAVLAQDFPAVPLWYYRTNSGYSTKVQNVAFDSFGNPAWTEVQVKG